jgi:hypothetical protein
MIYFDAQQISMDATSNNNFCGKGYQQSMQIHRETLHVRDMCQSDEDADQQDGGKERLKLAMNRALSELSLSVRQLASQHMMDSSDGHDQQWDNSGEGLSAYLLHDTEADAVDDLCLDACKSNPSTCVDVVCLNSCHTSMPGNQPTRNSGINDAHVLKDHTSTELYDLYDLSSEGTLSPQILSPWKARQIAQR